jgi:hypothetical protein
MGSGEFRWTFMGPSPWSKWSLSPPPRTVDFVTPLSPEECRQRLGDPAEPTRPSSPGQARQDVLHVVQGNRLWLVRQPADTPRSGESFGESSSRRPAEEPGSKERSGSTQGEGRSTSRCSLSLSFPF